MNSTFERWSKAYNDSSVSDPRYVMLWTDTTIMEDLADIVSNITAWPNVTQIGALQPSSTILFEVTEQEDKLHVTLMINDEPVPMTQCVPKDSEEKVYSCELSTFMPNLNGTFGEQPIDSFTYCHS